MADPIVHIQVQAQDLGQSSRFYSELFGWDMTPWRDSHIMFKAGAGPDGGLAKTPEPSKWDPIIFIRVADIDDKLKSVESAGGKTTMPKTQISPEIGYFAMFSDPAGNTIGLFSQQ